MVNDKYDTATVAAANLKTFTYDGKAQTFASAKLNVGNVVLETGESADTNIAKPTADDFELVYVDNVYGKSTQAQHTTLHMYMLLQKKAATILVQKLLLPLTVQ